MTITEYVQKFGKSSLNPFSLSESDMLVFTALSYINLATECKDFCTHRTLREAIELLFIGSLGSPEKSDFLQAILKSKRFSDVRICGYSEEFANSLKALQFSAMTFRISDSLWLICFRGTDGTLVGWKEDFQLSYKRIPAQEKAKEYLEDAAKNLSGNFIISGHSKGGNLAAYASLFCNSETQARINHVYCYDGPGFNEDTDIIHSAGYKNIIAKVSCIVPQDSIIGQLLNPFPTECFRVINSNASKMIYQHDIFSWQIAENGEPEWRDKLNVLSQKGMEKLNDLINHLSFQQRERLTEYIFDALEKQDIHNVDSLKFFIPLEFLKFF